VPQLLASLCQLLLVAVGGPQLRPHTGPQDSTCGQCL
jgi:hypothetical protein